MVCLQNFSHFNGLLDCLFMAKPLLDGEKNVRKTISSNFGTAVRKEQREIEVGM